MKLAESMEALSVPADQQSIELPDPPAAGFGHWLGEHKWPLVAGAGLGIGAIMLGRVKKKQRDDA